MRELRHRLLLMAGQVEQMIAHATQALVERDVELAKATIEDDYKVNSAEMEIDELCIHILARRQPVASDLRFVTFALKMVTDLERTGDLAVTICKRAINLSALPQPKPYVDNPQRAGIAQEMVRGAIDAFVSADVGQAEQVIARDEEVDDLYDRVYDDLLPLMHENPSLIEACTRVQSVNKALETHWRPRDQPRGASYLPRQGQRHPTHRQARRRTQRLIHSPRNPATAPCSCPASAEHSPVRTGVLAAPA